ncbi:molybdopterin-dependent oxidoreductase, partial [Schaalia georgiae]
ALEAGLLPGLAPFGRPLAGADATGLDWEGAPSERGLDAEGMLAAAARGDLGALVIGGVDVRDFADPDAVRAAIAATPFVVSLEVRSSEVARLADVVLPVAPPIEKNGTFINWEGRLRPFGQAVSARSLTDRDVLVRLAEEFGADLGITALSDLYAEANPLMDWEGAREAFAPAGTRPLPGIGEGQALL